MVSGMLWHSLAEDPPRFVGPVAYRCLPRNTLCFSSVRSFDTTLPDETRRTFAAHAALRFSRQASLTYRVGQVSKLSFAALALRGKRLRQLHVYSERENLLFWLVFPKMALKCQAYYQDNPS